MKLWDVVPRGQESLVLQYLERFVSQGRSSMETVLLAKDGRPIDVEIHATALLDQERGGLVHSRAFVRDVTERHRLEQELQHYTTGLEQAVSERTQELVASQARYKALFDLVADSVFMVNAAGTVVAVNKREEQALGYAESKVVGGSMSSVVCRHTGRLSPDGWLRRDPDNGKCRRRKSRSTPPRGTDAC